MSMAERSSENPLLSALGPPFEYDDLPEALAFDPLVGIDRKGMTNSQLEYLLTRREQYFSPSAPSLDIAQSIHKLVRAGLEARCPPAAAVDPLRMKLASFTGNENRKVPWLPTFAGGIAIEGITGMGKSKAVERALSLFPAQVVRHENGRFPGFHTQTQIVYLIVQMPADASKGGFLLNILTVIDKLIGTNYSIQYGNPRQFTIEKLTVIVSVLLAQHYCGVFVIEEVQERSLGRDIEAFTLFVLRILNFGIPVVLIGNPLGMDKLRTHAQDLRRFCSGGWFTLDPPLSASEFDFVEHVKSIFKFSVMERGLEVDSVLLNHVYSRTAGIPGFIGALNEAAQVNALRMNRRQLEIGDLEYAFQSPQMKESHPLIQGLVMRKPELISHLSDIPIEKFRRRWNSEQQGRASSGAQMIQVPPLEASTEKSAGSKGRSDADARKIQNAQQHEARQAKRAEAAKSELPPDDIRRSKGAGVLAEAFKDIMPK